MDPLIFFTATIGRTEVRRLQNRAARCATTKSKAKATASEGGRCNGHVNCNFNGNRDCKAASSRRTPRLVGGGFLFGEVGEAFSLLG